MTEPRFFKMDARTIRCVPAGASPRDYGVDPRAAVELDRGPGEHERHIGMRTGWRLDAAGRDRDHERARVQREASGRDWHLRVEAELAALRQRVAVLESVASAVTEG